MPTTSMAVPALSTKYGRERLTISENCDTHANSTRFDFTPVLTLDVHFVRPAMRDMSCSHCWAELLRTYPLGLFPPKHRTVGNADQSARCQIQRRRYWQQES